MTFIFKWPLKPFDKSYSCHQSPVACLTARLIHLLTVCRCPDGCLYTDCEKPASHSFLLLSFSAALYQVCTMRWHQTPSMLSVPLTAIAKYGCGPAGWAAAGQLYYTHSMTFFQRIWALFFLADFPQTGENILIRNISTICTLQHLTDEQDVRMYEWLFQLP